MKFSGKIGFWISDVEIKPGVYKPSIVERPYTGDVLRNVRKNQIAENQQNSNLILVNKISILSDLYMQKNWPTIKYIFWNGVNWKVNSVDVTPYPRIVIELGGVYNGRTKEAGAS